MAENELTKDLLNAAVLRWMNDLAAQGILMTDTELRILGWNQWLEERTGNSLAEVLGRKLPEIYPDLITRRLDRYYKWALEGQVRVLSQRLHGYLLTMPSVTAAPYPQMQQTARISPLLVGNRVVGTLTIIDDVTERVAREAELQSQIEIRSQLLASEKAARQAAEDANRIKNDFLATISHELRTPLNAIIGWASMLNSGKLDEKNTLRAIDTIYRNAQAQGKLIGDLLDISRIVSGKLRLDTRPIDLPPIVESAVNSMRPAAEAKGIAIVTEVDAHSGPISGDADRMQQVIWNLLNNAVKFTPKGGRVDVKLERINSHVEITISDTGIGIAPEFLPHVFDRFRQAEAAATRLHGGLGLGLSIVRQLVELHGGAVHVASEGEGKGATFTVTLPCLVPREQQAEARINSTPNVLKGDTDLSLSQVRVVVVDDELETLDLLRAVLERCGATVITGRSAAEGLVAVKQELPDVLISDLGMPGEDGYTLISRVRALSPEQGGQTPAAALTAFARIEDRLRVLRAGFQIHLPKPVEPAELVEVVANLARRSLRSEAESNGCGA